MTFSLIRSLIFVSLIIFSSSFLGCHKATVENPTMIYLVRHAEKAQPIQMAELMSTPSKDPELSETGKNRAQLLKELMAKEDISGIFSTAYKRTMHTVQPLSDSLSIPIQTYDMQNVKGIIDSLITETSGKRFLFSGHSNTILPIIDYLNAQRPQENIAEGEYDKIFKVIVRADTSLVQVTTY